jgi:TrmH family RNA methyltransferase
LGEGTVSAFNPKVIRASAGSVFRLPFIQAKLKEFLGTLHHHSFRIMATSSHRGAPLNEIDLTQRVAIMIGNEGAGIPRDLTSVIDDTVAIPHSPKVESLNAGIAASILLYEASRQRGAGSPPRP